MLTRASLSALALIQLIEEAEDFEEQVDDVEIEGNGRVDVLLRRHLVHDHVGVVDDVEAEEHCAGNRDHKVQHRVSQEHLESDSEYIVHGSTNGLL